MIVAKIVKVRTIWCRLVDYQKSDSPVSLLLWVLDLSSQACGTDFNLPALWRRFYHSGLMEWSKTSCYCEGSNLTSLWCRIYHPKLVVLVLTYLLCGPVLSFQASGTHSNLTSLWYRVYHSRLVVLNLTYLLCGAGSIIRACGIGSNLPALKSQFNHSRLVVPVLTCFLCGAGYIIPDFG